MDKMDESTLKLLKRIKSNAMLDGDYDQLIAYFEKLSLDNYKAFKAHGSEMDSIHKGYALCVDYLIECFADCDKEIDESKLNIHAQEYAT